MSDFYMFFFARPIFSNGLNYAYYYALVFSTHSRARASIWTNFNTWLIDNYEENNDGYRRTILDLLETIETDLKSPQ